MKLYRDGYNRTNLDIKLGPLELEFKAIDEPWDGPGVRFLARLSRRFWVLNINWGAP